PTRSAARRCTASAARRACTCAPSTRAPAARPTSRSIPARSARSSHRSRGGAAYESLYPGPIGAILTPQLRGLDQAPTLPWASSLCGACYEACPVKIDIPSVLVHLRARVGREEKARLAPGEPAM